jgi:hypothetical protein
MTRVLLPLAVIAAIIFGPLFAEVTTGPVTGEKLTPLTGNYFIADTITCFRNGEFSIAGDCEPELGLKGKAVFAATLAAAVAAALGVIGLLPFIGRLTSIFTMIAGVVIVASMGYFGMNILGAEDESVTLQWGTYLAGGLGLLTLISGLSGMRGK